MHIVSLQRMLTPLLTFSARTATGKVGWGLIRSGENNQDAPASCRAVPLAREVRRHQDEEFRAPRSEKGRTMNASDPTGHGPRRCARQARTDCLINVSSQGSSSAGQIRFGSSRLVTTGAPSPSRSRGSSTCCHDRCRSAVASGGYRADRASGEPE